MGKNWKSFNISDSGIFKKLDENYIEKRFKEFNSTYFSGKLSLDGVEVVHNKEKSNSLGCVISTYNSATNTSQVIRFSIGDGKQDKGGRTEKTWCEVILHEMIHVYQVQVLKLSQQRFGMESGHGSEFVSKMEEINKAGEWQIGTTETGEQNETFILKKKSNKYLFSCPYKDSQVLIGLVKKSEAFELLKKNPELECYKIIEKNNFIEKLKTVKDKIEGAVKEADFIQTLQSKGAIEDKPVILIDPKIRKDHYALYFKPKHNEQGILKLISKSQYEEYKDLELDEYSLHFYKILKGKYFVNFEVTDDIQVSGYVYNKEDINDLIKKGAIERYKFLESLKYIFEKTLKETEK